MDVWVYDNEEEVGCALVANGGGTIDPEEWVRDHGAAKFPNVIYFFAELVTDEPLVAYDDTLTKVYDVLRRYDVGDMAQSIIGDILNKGVYFREVRREQ
jgi:hypothetical protein